MSGPFVPTPGEGPQIGSSSIPARLRVLIVASIVVTTAAFVVVSGASPSARDSSQLAFCQESVAQHAGELARLTSDSFVAGPRVGAAPSPAIPVLVSLSNESNWSAAGLSCYDYSLEYVAPNITVGDTAFEVKTDFCANVSEPLAIQILAADGALLASENLASHGWGPATSVALSAGDSVLISASGPLTADELDSKVTGVVSGSSWVEEQGMQIVPNPSGWDGCGF